MRKWTYLQIKRYGILGFCCAGEKPVVLPNTLDNIVRCLKCRYFLQEKKEYAV